MERRGSDKCAFERDDENGRVEKGNVGHEVKGRVMSEIRKKG